MSAAARVIDANANRAREALRVLEDAARFALNDAVLCAQLKDLRHALQGALSVLPQGWLLAHRDVVGDVGQEISGEHEMNRPDHHAVVVAAGKRLGEALRSIEEALKMVDMSAARRVEQLRYAAYQAEAALVLRMGNSRRRQWRVCVLLTESLCALPWQQVVEGALAGGACCIQVREKSMPTRQLAERVRAVVAAAEKQSNGSCAVVVNDRVDVALACGAHGVHVGADDLSIEDARKVAGTSLLIGASTHSVQEASRALAAGADYCGVGAMFATATKPSVAPQGEQYLRGFLSAHPSARHLAIGGVSPSNVAALAAAGARGVAVSSCVCGAADPAAVVRELAKALP
jgi:thiamine-phosphate pyrophosphorylase